MNSKALSIFITASILSPQAVSAQAACDCATVPTTDFSFTYDGRCTGPAFIEEATADQQCQVECAYKAANPDTALTLAGIVKELCVAGYQDQEFLFTDIAKKGAQFDNEHYSGGGEWNYEVETATGEDRLKVDASRVDDVYYYEAQRKVIQFPEHIESFNPYNSANSINGIPDLDGCDLNAAYCCFAQDRQAGDNNGNCATPYEYNCNDKDPADNTNICYIDHSRSAKSSHVNAGFSIFGDLVNNKENIEGSVHCHGFAWPEDELHQDSVLKGNLLFYVSMYDHMTQRGYVRNIPGSPMCACAENMAVVTRADCTQVSTTEKTTFSMTAGTVGASIDIRDVNFNACQGAGGNNNNLQARVEQFNSEGKVSDEKYAAVSEVLVGSTAGQCNDAIRGFLTSKNISEV